jgi:transcriptional regulator with GAF, ATPase, and Fis domain
LESAPSFTLEDIQRSAILRALEATNGVVGGPNGAAALLGIKRTSLQARMRKLGIEPVQRAYPHHVLGARRLSAAPGI